MAPLAHMAEFASRYRELAAVETRVVALPQPYKNLPAGEYGFLEFYCDEPTCDCRRVLLQVRQPERPQVTLATINYGWETEAFYTRWLHGDRASARELCGAALDPLNPQSRWSPILLEIFRQVVLLDQNYIARLKRHYHLFKQTQHRSPSRTP